MNECNFEYQLIDHSNIFRHSFDKTKRKHIFYNLLKLEISTNYIIVGNYALRFSKKKKVNKNKGF